MIGYKYCPVCAGTLSLHGGESGNPYVRCQDCGFSKWNNPLPTTIGLVAREGEVLLLRRAVAPAVGAWDTIGGFLSPGESAEECLGREAIEEIGCSLEIREILGTYPSVYGDTGLPTIGVAFLCEPPIGVIRLSAENSDHAWFDLNDLPRIAFADVSDALAALARRTTTLILNKPSSGG